MRMSDASVGKFTQRLLGDGTAADNQVTRNSSATKVPSASLGTTALPPLTTLSFGVGTSVWELYALVPHSYCRSK